ncbi:unnamed protein product [Anisakis simplex]|uniref:Sugar phosphate exchanger 3 n=1 Tax=Anisakis simplex TaxID=6269 RepID=A0A0M3JQS9_ANISI|nr:unnamed protein product [Anisakis simplex]
MPGQRVSSVGARRTNRERVRGRQTLSNRLIVFLSGGEYWTHHHFVVFALTFLSYALLHASRKTLSAVKTSLVDVWTGNGSGVDSNLTVSALFPDAASAEQFLAVLDFAFLAAYALGLYISGLLGDRYNASNVLAIGMWLSSITVFLFGSFTGWLQFYSKIFYVVVWIASGLVQSIGWPTEICIMGNWFGHNSRGTVFGVWSACASIGNILGTLIASQTVQIGYEVIIINRTLMIDIAFLIAVIINFVIIFIWLPDPLETREDVNRVIEEVTERPKAISFWRAWLLPGVISYSLAYACLKLVNYSFFFWLPFYLHNRFGWPESLADELSTWYDWGGIVAAIIAGILSDHLSSRTPIVVTMLFVSMGAVFAYANSPNNILINSLLMILMGFFIGGPANLISSTVSADIGRCDEVRGSSEALSTVTGIIDGTGSIGASIGQLLLPIVERRFGWIYVFYSFIFMMMCTFVCLLPLLWKECFSVRQRHGYALIHSDSEDLLSNDTANNNEQREESTEEVVRNA